MIEFMAESSGNIVGVRATGALTDIDYKDILIPRLEKLFDEHGKLRILFYIQRLGPGGRVGRCSSRPQASRRFRPDRRGWRATMGRLVHQVQRPF
jgi:SpoIIAA-like